MYIKLRKNKKPLHYNAVYKMERDINSHLKNISSFDRKKIPVPLLNEIQSLVNEAMATVKILKDKRRMNKLIFIWKVFMKKTISSREDYTPSIVSNQQDDNLFVDTGKGITNQQVFDSIRGNKGMEEFANALEINQYITQEPLSLEGLQAPIPKDKKLKEIYQKMLDRLLDD